MDIIQRCKFCFVGCCQTSRTSFQPAVIFIYDHQIPLRRDLRGSHLLCKFGVSPRLEMLNECSVMSLSESGKATGATGASGGGGWCKMIVVWCPSVSRGWGGGRLERAVVAAGTVGRQDRGAPDGSGRPGLQWADVSLGLYLCSTSTVFICA